MLGASLRKKIKNSISSFLSFSSICDIAYVILFGVGVFLYFDKLGQISAISSRIRKNGDL